MADVHIGTGVNGKRKGVSTGVFAPIGECLCTLRYANLTEFLVPGERFGAPSHAVMSPPSVFRMSGGHRKFRSIQVSRRIPRLLVARTLLMTGR